MFRKASPSVWLDLRSGAPGLAGPFIQEFNAAYRHLDEFYAWRPKVILAIGGNANRKAFAEREDNLPDDDEIGSISIRTLLAHPDALLIDCRMHQSIDPPRVLGGPVPGHYLIHCLERRNSRAAPLTVAARLYSEILSLFSSVVLIFVSDFDGVQNIVEFLVQWILAAMTSQTSNYPLVYLVVDPAKPFLEQEIWRRISRRLLDQPDSLDSTECRGPTKSHTSWRHWPQYLRLKVIPQTSTASALTEAISRYPTSAQMYTAGHLKYMLKKAIIHFAKDDGSPFDPCRAYHKDQLFLRQWWQRRAPDFLQQIGSKDQASTLASALVYALPPGIHRFSPEFIFSKLYQIELNNLTSRMGQPDFLFHVREAFLNFATEHRVSKSLFRTLHMHRLRSQSSKWSSEAIWGSCCSCVVNPPRYTLHCHHRLCATCVVTWGRMKTPWTYEIARCPLCDAIERAYFTLKPPTAAARVLNLSGLAPENMLQFLEDLHRKIGGFTIPLQDYFDIIIASEFGTFFLITTFLEGWSYEVCKYHLRRSKRPIIDQAGNPTFGEGLAWTWSELRNSNDISILIHRENDFYSNFIPHGQEAEILSTQASKSNADYTSVQYACDGYGINFLESTAGSLTAELFYLELSQAPKFYSSPDECVIHVRCRLDPGKSLPELLLRLRQQSAQLVYREDRGSYMRSSLCTDATFAMCKDGKPFSKRLRIKLDSIDSCLDVKIQTSEFCQSISKCPYRLRQLIHDQGMDHLDDIAHYDRADTEHCSDAIVRLQKTLAGFASRSIV